MERLAKYLSDAEISQVEFAKRLGVSQPTVSDWVNGAKHPSTENLIALSKVTGIGVDELLGLRKKAS